MHVPPTAAGGGAGTEGGEAAGDRHDLRTHCPAHGQDLCHSREWEAGHAAVSNKGKEGTLLTGP